MPYSWGGGGWGGGEGGRFKHQTLGGRGGKRGSGRKERGELFQRLGRH